MLNPLFIIWANFSEFYPKMGSRVDLKVRSLVVLAQPRNATFWFESRCSKFVQTGLSIEVVYFPRYVHYEEL